MALMEPEVASRMRCGDVDLAHRLRGAPEDRTTAIEQLHLLEDPMYLALPEDHPLARKRGLRLADLADEPGSAAPPAASAPPRSSSALPARRLRPADHVRDRRLLAIQGFVAAGVGVSLIAELGLITVRDDIVVRLAGPRPPVRLIYADGADGLPLARHGGDARRAAEVGAERTRRGRPGLELVGRACRRGLMPSVDLVGLQVVEVTVGRRDGRAERVVACRTRCSQATCASGIYGSLVPLAPRGAIREVPMPSRRLLGTSRPKARACGSVRRAR